MNRQSIRITLVATGLVFMAACASHYSALYKAAEHNDTAAIQQLVSSGTSPNTKEHNNRTPLHAAALKGNLDAAKALLAAGADPNAQDDRGETPLMLAASNGYGPMVTAMLEKKPPLDTQSHRGATALQFAVENGHADIARELSKAGANPNIVDNQGRSAASVAGAKGISLIP